MAFDYEILLKFGAFAFGSLILTACFIFFGMFKRKAYFLKYDTSDDGKGQVMFLEKPKRYRIVNRDGRRKIKILGIKTKIPYEDNLLNPSHHGSYGLAIIQRGEDYFACDIKFHGIETIIKDEKGGLWAKTGTEINKITNKEEIQKYLLFPAPIPYNLRMNFVENIGAIHDKFTPKKQFYISAAIFVIAIIASLALIIIVLNKVENIIPQTVAVAQNGVDEMVKTRVWIQNLTGYAPPN